MKLYAINEQWVSFIKITKLLFHSYVQVYLVVIPLRVCLDQFMFLWLCSADLSKPANSLYLHNLTGVLESAIRATNAQFEDQDILNRLDVRLLEVSQGDKGWDVFSLLYRVDGPIETVS